LFLLPNPLNSKTFFSTLAESEPSARDENKIIISSSLLGNRIAEWFQ
jgi:hypothetical protein